MALNKKFFPKVSAAATDTFTPSEHFNTVLYTGNGSTQRIGGYINRGAVFNGSNSKIQLPNNLVNDISPQTFSVSFWFRTDNLTSYQQAFSAYDFASGTNYGWSIYTGYSSSKVRFVSYSSNGNMDFSGATTLSANTWYHCVLTYPGGSGTAKLYLNGSEDGSETIPGNRTYKSDHTYYIGAANNGAGGTEAHYSGVIDQVRVFSKSLSQSEVTTLYGETHSSTTISTPDIFGDSSSVALYQLDGNANNTGDVYGGTQVNFTANSAAYSITSALASSGKYYWEVEYKDFTTSATLMVGIINSAYQESWTNAQTKMYYANNGQKYTGGSGASYGASFTKGDIIGVALDLDANDIEFFKNGVSQGTAFTGLTGTYPNYRAALGTGGTGTESAVQHFDSNKWTYSAPSGFGEWTAARTGSISVFNGSQEELTKNGTASNVVYQEATKFTPDLVWIKSRNIGYSHSLQDTVRGTGTSTVLNTDLSVAEGTYGAYGQITSFDTNGFTVASGGHSQYGTAQVNDNGYTYVAWCFNAGSGSSASNTDGSITSTVKANTDAGFSIVTYSGNSGSSATIGHGLNSAPELIITKSRGHAAGFPTMANLSSGSIYGLRLNSSGANDTANGSIFYNNTDPTNSVYTVGSSDETNDSYNYVSYCFHSVDGYQKIGSYTSDGSDGDVFVETDFEPAFLMIKNTSATYDWVIFDNKRDTANLRDSKLSPNTTSAEYSATSIGVDFTSDGFVVRGTDDAINHGTSTFIYLAIAADPDTTTPTVENSFDVVTYTGTGAAQDIETDFKPDLIWVKRRNSTGNNEIYDSVRGEHKVLQTDNSSAEFDYSTNGVTSFDSNGFSVAGSAGNHNVSGGTFVAWVWKAGDHDDNLPEINTEGTIDSTVSVNDAAGFSIVKYRGTLTSAGNISVGHGLSSAPELIISKRTDSTGPWRIRPFFLNNNAYDYLEFDSGALAQLSSGDGTMAVPTSTTFDNNWNSGIGASGDIIAYCWYSVSGHSKIGSYSGNSTSGRLINIGFQARWVMIKTTNATSNWFILDSQRGGTKDLRPNSSNAEETRTNGVTFVSNGFEIDDTSVGFNNTGTNYIYMAFK